VGIVEVVPMGGAPESNPIRIPERPAVTEKEKPYAAYTIASPGYFSAVGTPLLQGRDFLESDRGDSTPVAIINNSMAKKFWPRGDAIGKQVGTGRLKDPLMTIIGIVADVKHITFREDSGPEMYVPYTQKPWPSMLRMQVAVRTLADPTSVTGSVRSAIHSVDPDLPMAKIATLTTLADNSMAQPRFSMFLFASLGVLALLLASVGMYGVISYSVAQRTQEIGVRMALGAGKPDLLRMILRQGLQLAAAGVLLGLAIAYGLTRVLASLLFGVQAADPFTFGGVAMILLLIALAATWYPARRAAAVEPVEALRYQ
jgi:predicted permease